MNAIYRLVGVGLALVALSAAAWAAEAEGSQSDDEGLELVTGGQSRQSMANDQSAAQWTFTVGHQWMDYRTDEIAPGVTRPQGIDRHFMGRVVMPIPKSDKIPISLLPRLTVRYATAQDGKSGLGASDLFILAVLSDWGTGRFGIGPLVTFPAEDERLGLTDWTYGFSLGVSQRLFNDRLSLFAVAGQTWGPLDPFRPEAEDIEGPLTLNPVVIYQLTDDWYISNGDVNIRYDWHKGGWLVPLGLRVGRLWVQETGTWNAYIEYQTSVIYDKWQGSAPEHQLRLALGYSIPLK